MLTPLVMAVAALGLLLLAGLLYYVTDAGVERRYRRETANAPVPVRNEVPLVTEELIAPLPALVQEWIRRTGAVGKPLVSMVRASAELEVRAPKSQAWRSVQAEGVHLYHPSFAMWQLQELRMGPLRNHQFYGLLVGDAGVQVSASPRLLASMFRGLLRQTLVPSNLMSAWMDSPASLALLPVSWEILDGRAVAATLATGDSSTRIEVRFDANGNFAELLLDLPTAPGAEPEPNRFRITDWRTIDGRQIAVAAELDRLEDGTWTPYQRTRLHSHELRPA